MLAMVGIDMKSAIPLYNFLVIDRIGLDGPSVTTVMLVKWYLLDVALVKRILGARCVIEYNVRTRCAS